MIFADLLIEGGEIRDQRSVDTAAFDDETYLPYARLLGRLRRGMLRAEIESQRYRLAVSFRQPSFAESIADRIEETGRSFTVCADDANVFLVSLLLDGDEQPNDHFDCFTLLTLSEATCISKANTAFNDRIQSLMDLRPCLIHAAICIETSDRMAVPVIRECSTRLVATVLAGH